MLMIGISIWLYICCCISVLDLAGKGGSLWRKCVFVPMAPLVISWVVFTVAIEKLNEVIT